MPRVHRKIDSTSTYGCTTFCTGMGRQAVGFTGDHGIKTEKVLTGRYFALCFGVHRKPVDSAVTVERVKGIEPSS